VRAGQEARPVQNLPLPPERESNLVDPFSCGREEVRDGTGLETGTHKNRFQTTKTKLSFRRS